MSYIDPRAKVFAHLDRLTAWQRGERPAPVTLEWDLSNRCTLGCEWCAYAHSHTRGPWAGRASLPMAEAPAGDLADPALLYRALPEVAAAGVRSVIWAGGGEPLTHPAWRDALAWASGAHLAQGMYTSGLPLHSDDVGVLAAHLTWVVVSLDAVTAADYARRKRTREARFADVCERVRWLAAAERPLVIGVSFLLDDENADLVLDMVALGRSLGASYVTLRPAISVDAEHPGCPVGDRAWVTRVLPLLRTLAVEAPDVEVDPARFEAWRDWKGHPYRACYGIRLTATVTPDGRVWVCPNRRQHAGPSCLGDLRHESFMAIWRRHPGHWRDFRACRAMCRLHQVNESLDALYAERAHASFI